MKNWNDLAYNALETFVSNNKSKLFMLEDVRVLSEQDGLKEPFDKRAWGAIAVQGRKNGLIKSMGYGTVKNINAHSTPATIWKAL